MTQTLRDEAVERMARAMWDHYRAPEDPGWDDLRNSARKGLFIGFAKRALDAELTLFAERRLKVTGGEADTEAVRLARDNIPGGIHMYSDIEATYRAVSKYLHYAPCALAISPQPEGSE